MKQFLLVLLALVAATAGAQTDKTVPLTYVDASQFTLVGKLMPGTPCRYARVDTVKYKGFTTAENLQVRESSGLALAFSTNSRSITVKTQFGEVQYPQNTNGIGGHGYDLYIKKDGVWRFAAAGARSQKYIDRPLSLISHMDGATHQCLLYLPLFAEVKHIEIGIDSGATIQSLPNPFRHRIGVFGSSYTHGSSTSRAGMTWPAQLSRLTGLQLLSLGCSGHSKLQSYFANVLADAQVDAFLFDAFSNPSPQQIKERLFPFIERVQKAHPGVPLIFQRTIHDEGCTFNTQAAADEAARMAVSDSLMAIAVKRYPDVYYITPNATSDDHNASVDGTHPTNYGYTLWARSIAGQLLPILAKYGIK